MSVKNIKFEDLVVGLSRKKRQDQIVDVLVSKHSGRIDELVQLSINADRNRLEGLTRIYMQMPDKAYPKLLEVILGDDISHATIVATIFSQMNGKGVDAALEIIQHADPIIAERGAAILRSMGFEAIPLLREKLKVENPPKRALAILMELDPEAVRFFENALEEMLSTQDQILARYAIDAAASIGDYALPILIDLIGSHDPYEQQNATNALIKIGEPIIVELIEELDNPNGITQQNAMRALKEIGLPAVPALKEALDSESQLIKQNVTAILKSQNFKTKRNFFSRKKP